MDHISRMHKEEASENLVHKVLYMFITQILPGINDTMEVCLHQLGYYIDVDVASPCFGFEQIHHVYDILMLEEF